jgi:hypothetical protein
MQGQKAIPNDEIHPGHESPSAILQSPTTMWISFYQLFFWLSQALAENTSIE